VRADLLPGMGRTRIRRDGRRLLRLHAGHHGPTHGCMDLLVRKFGAPRAPSSWCRCRRLPDRFAYALIYYGDDHFLRWTVRKAGMKPLKPAIPTSVTHLAPQHGVEVACRWKTRWRRWLCRAVCLPRPPCRREPFFLRTPAGDGHLILEGPWKRSTDNASISNR